MSSLIDLANQLDEEKRTCRAIIETSRGDRNKFAYDPDTKLFMLKGLLPEGMVFPFDFGFIPSTLADDGDPMDILIFMDSGAHVGSLLIVRIIGIIKAKETENGKTETNDRLLGAAVHSYQHEDLKSIKDLSQPLLSQIEEFFVSYNKQRGKKFKVTGMQGPKKAIGALKECIKRYEARLVSIHS